MSTRITTYQYRIKDGNTRCERALREMAGCVNFVWNYINETTQTAWKRDRKWLSAYTLDKLLTGSSKLLKLHSQTIQAISKEHADRRNQFSKCKLRWRTAKKNTGWIPFKASGVKVYGDTVTYQGVMFRFWKSREWPEGAKLKTGEFSQDARGRWYINFKIQVSKTTKWGGVLEEGIDLGLKDQINCSSGKKYGRQNLTKKYEQKLGAAQRAKKKKQVRTVHAKIKNTRKDWSHKQSTKIVKRCMRVAFGGINAKALMKTNMAKSVADAGWGLLMEMLLNKAIAHGVEIESVNESYTTQTCHGCGERTGPKGLEGLGVRVWRCECGLEHDRDTNSGLNIFKKAYGRLPYGAPPMQKDG